MLGIGDECEGLDSFAAGPEKRSPAEIPGKQELSQHVECLRIDLQDGFLLLDGQVQQARRRIVCNSLEIGRPYVFLLDRGAVRSDFADIALVADDE